MFKKLLVPLFLFMLPTFIYSQFEVNKHNLGASVGFSFLGSASQFGINHEYGLSLEDLGIKKIGKVGIGGIFRYWSYNENFTSVKWDYSNYLLGVQGNYHFYMHNESIDPWAGLVLAYNFGSVDSKIKDLNTIINEPSSGGLWLGVHAGVRYWINKNIAVNMRIGFGTLSYGALDLGFDYQF